MESFLSFRDPSGGLFKIDDRLFRLITDKGFEETKDIFNSEILKQLEKQNKFISAKQLKLDEVQKLLSQKISDNLEIKMVLEHEKLFFPSYPYEWSSFMLYDAAKLTLEIASKLLEEGRGIKDATPYNILFSGPNPIFIDFTSIEKRNLLDPIWLAYSQFMRMFLLPLLLNKYKKMPLSDIFINRLDGIDIEETKNYLGWNKLFSLKALSLVYIPYLLSKKKNRESYYKKHLLKNKDISKFILKSLYNRACKTLKKLSPQKPKKSVWMDYMDTKSHYSDDLFSLKQQFVLDVLEKIKPKTVLDIGCNTGHFSVLSADKGAKVVALDYDRASIDLLYLRAKKENKDILPLVANICRPTPSIGWNNQECVSLLKRSEKKFDLVLMLAVIHHMIVSERIPLSEIASIISKITKRYLILEFVKKEDMMFKVLVRGRDHLYEHINLDNFKKIFSRYFKIKIERPLQNSNRVMFLLEKINNVSF